MAAAFKPKPYALLMHPMLVLNLGYLVENEPSTQLLTDDLTFPKMLDFGTWEQEIRASTAVRTEWVGCNI